MTESGEQRKLRRGGHESQGQRQGRRLAPKAHKKSHGMSLHRHAMTSILMGDSPCPTFRR